MCKLRCIGKYSSYVKSGMVFHSIRIPSAFYTKPQMPVKLNGLPVLFVYINLANTQMLNGIL